MKIGCCVTTKNIIEAKKIGYDFVELPATEIMKFNDEQWEKKKNDILKIGIPILGFNAFCDEKLPIIGPNAQIEKWYSYSKKVISRASELGCQNIGIGAPKARFLPKNYSYDLGTSEIHYFLETIAKIAQAYSINILYEAINPKECNFGTHTQEIYETIKKLNYSNLKIVYDIYHAINSNEKYEDSKDFFSEINHIHINSWDEQLNRFFILPKDEKYVKDFFIFLKSINYNKTISIEANDNNFKENGQTAYNILLKVIKEINDEN